MYQKYKKNYKEFMECLGPCDAPIISYYSDEVPNKYIGPVDGFDMKINKISDAVNILVNFNNAIKIKDEKYHCMLEYIMETRKTGIPSVFNYENYGCLGFRFYAGFIPKLPVFNHFFVSTGFPGLYPGERFVNRPKSAKHAANKLEGRVAKKKNIIFKPFDKLDEEVTPEVVTFFANPEIITGLVGMVRFVSDKDDAVRSIYCSGCSSVFAWPAQFQFQGIEDQAVLGIFDLAARPHLNLGEMTIAMSFSLFKKILNCYKKSFLYKQKKYANSTMKDAVFSWKDGKERAVEYEGIMKNSDKENL